MAEEKQWTNAELAFDHYQSILEWIDRRQQPETLEFYDKDRKEYWHHAKEVAFMMYQNLRHLLGDTPRLHDLIDKENAKDVPPYKFKDGVGEFPCVGVLKYRDREYPVYDDAYGMSWFVVVDDRSIEVDSFGGETDWYFELDRIIDRIYD